MKNWMQKAREASGLTLEECASLLYVSREAFVVKDQNPGTLTLNELRALHSAFNPDARKILKDALHEVFL